MSTITFDSKAFKAIMDKLTFLEKSVKIMSGASGFNRWIHEEEAMAMTGLKQRRLRELRKDGTLGFRTASGRKIQYWRKDVETYLNKFSTVKTIKQ